MELKLIFKSLDFVRKKKKWVLLLAAFGFAGFGSYRIYHSPAVSRKRERLLKLLGALVSVAEAVSDSAETLGAVSKDLKEYLQSDSDQIPNSLKQISKIARSDEFSQSIMGITQALIAGILRGCRLGAASNNGVNANSSSVDQVMDKLFSDAGSGFASVVVGSFARSLVMAIFSDERSNSIESASINHLPLEKNSVPRWVNELLCSGKCRELIGDCVQLFVSTAVAVYLEKTMHINTYDELFTGLTNPKHETKVREMLVTVCNGAIETFVKTSHQVLTSCNLSSNPNPGSPYLAIDQGQVSNGNELNGKEALFSELNSRTSFDESKDDGWANKLSSTLAEPCNRKFVLEVTGRITFETVRSFLELLLERLYDGMKNCVNVVNQAVLEAGLEVVRYVSAKSSVIATICLSLCLHILGGVWVLVPA